MKKKAHRFHLTPPQTITLSFAAMILTGALLLNLPIASQDGRSIGFLNALFTATSANCVTGLIVVNTLQHWTVFGKVVILALIQLGGLGFITILTLSMMLLRQRISLRNRTVIQTAFNQDSVGGMVRLIKVVVRTTLIIEAVGAVLLALSFYFAHHGEMPVGEAVYKGIFHSISAFCNAGFDIVGPNSLTPYQGNLAINVIIMALIVFGGLGFVVWGEMLAAVKSPKKQSLRHRFQHFSLHSKLALLFTAILIMGGMLLFLVIEWENPNTLGGLPVPQKILAAFFQSVTLRTAGFNTIDQAGLADVSKVISSLLMIIGGSPAGTAGGFKTVTLAVILFAMFSAFRGKNRVEAFGRTIPMETLQKALTVTFTLIFVMFTATMILHFTEQSNPFPHGILDLFFETSSAAGTVGVTTGITPHLSSPGKVVVLLCMFLGRLGPITVAVSLNMRMRAAENTLTYPDEKVIIG